jgi:sterol desaturase/sphingolipid hydroxylase (fatty acid hydroxylase superfamily)
MTTIRGAAVSVRSPALRETLSALLQRHAFAALLVANAGLLALLHAVAALSEASVIALHFANIVVLATLELVHPLNRDWLVVDEAGRIRWRLLSKTYLWYLFDSRVWFRVHGLVLYAGALWVAQHVAVFDLSSASLLLQLALLAVGVDFVRYWIHRGQHALSFLWRWHTMHHAPTHMTPVRAWWTHPVDDVILYSFEIFFMVVMGFDAAAILAYVSLDNLFQLTNHANVRMASGRLGVVFQHPRYHLLHHRRCDDGETSVNFGEMFTLWDRLFGTFESRPLESMETLEIGIAPARRRSLLHCLTAPFWRRADEL